MKFRLIEFMVNKRKPLAIVIGISLAACFAVNQVQLVYSDVYSMDPYRLVSMVLDAFGVLVAAVFFWGFTINPKAMNEQSVLLAAMFSTNAFVLSADVSGLYFRGNVDYAGFSMWVNSAYYFMGRLLNIYGLKYIALVSKFRKTEDRKIVRIGEYVGIFSLVEVFLNYAFKFYFYIDEAGCYQRNGYIYYLCYVSSAVLMVIDLLIIRKSHSSKKTKNSFSLFVGICFVSAIVQPFVPFSIIYLGTLFALLLLYMNVQVRSSKELLMKDVWNQKQEKEIAERESEIMLQKMRIMQSQMQPHFLYNGMASIRRLIMKDPDKAIDAMDHFIKYLRGNVDLLSEDKLVPITQELDFVKNYLEIERIRFGDKISFEIYDYETDFSVPPMSIQTLVENAISHGIRKRPDGTGRVVIETGSTDKEYCVEVKDNGVGFDVNAPEYEDKEKTHVGLSNTKYRIETLCKGKFIVHSKKDKGTTIKIYIPFGGENENTVNR